MNIQQLIKKLRDVKITKGFVFAYGFFLVFMLMDFVTTAYMAEGNIALEGNRIAVWWWDLLGVFRHIDFIIWPAYVFGIMYFFAAFSRFIALWWVWGIGFAHVLGWLTWHTYAVSNFLYTTTDLLPGVEKAYLIPLTLYGMFLGLIISMAIKILVNYKAGQK